MTPRAVVAGFLIAVVVLVTYALCDWLMAQTGPCSACNGRGVEQDDNDFPCDRCSGSGLEPVDD